MTNSVAGLLALRARPRAGHRPDLHRASCSWPGPGSGWAARCWPTGSAGGRCSPPPVSGLSPMLVTPPLFTRDVFSYLAQGALPLAGFDPYAVGPEAMPGVFTDNVHYFWQDTPAPYGPLFILIAKSVAWASGDNIIARRRCSCGWRCCPAWLLLVWALPELTRRLGGRVAGGAVGRRRQPDDGHPHGRRRAQRPAGHRPARGGLAVRAARPARRRHRARHGRDGGQGQRGHRAAVPRAGVGRRS